MTSTYRMSGGDKTVHRLEFIPLCMRTRELLKLIFSKNINNANNCHYGFQGLVVEVVRLVILWL